MAFSFTKFLKGLTIREENTTVPKEIDIVPGGNSATKTTITTSQTADRTITMPDATTTVVGTDVSQTLTNKTIDADNNTISNIENDNIKVGASIDATKIADGTVSNTEFQYLDGVNGSIQNQLDNKADASTAVTLNGAQTLTNKTIDADNNTISNIDNNEIKALAGIDATKIADGSVENTEFQYLNGVTSGIQGQLDGKASSGDLTAHTGASSGVHGVTGNVVGTTDTQTLTNKTLTAPTIADFTNATHNHQNAAGGGQISLTAAVTGTLPIANGGTNATSATTAFNNLSPLTTKGDVIVHNGTDNVRQAIGTDGQVLVADSAQTNGLKWSNISGIKNYILNEGAESNVSGWVAYADAAASRPVDGTGGSPNVTITRTTSVPLRGVGSFLLTKDAANRQGQGVSYDFTIDNADQAKVLNISFDWEVGSGTYSGGSSSTDSDVIVYIYDVTNARVIEPAPIKLDGAVIGTEYKYVGSFQTSSNSTSYRLILHCATTSASAYTVKFDNVVVGPSVVTTGAYISDEQTTISTIGATTTPPTKGTVAFDRTVYWREGQHMIIRYNYRQSASGSNGTGTYLIPVPNSLSIDTTNLVIGSFVSATDVGSGKLYNGTTTFDGQVVVWNAQNLALQIQSQSADFAGWGAANGGLGNATIEVTFTAKVPISGWGTSQALSSETDTRVVAMRAATSAGQSITGTPADIVFGTRSYDTHGALNTSTGIYTVPVAGKYRVSAQVGTTGTTFGTTARLILYINRNGSDVAQNRVHGTGGNNVYCNNATTTFDCNAGDTIKIRVQSDVNTTLIASTEQNYFDVERISGPSQIAASESVNCRYKTDAGQSIPNNTSTVVNFEDIEFDSHVAVTTGAGWLFRAPVSGVYSVKSALEFSSGGGWAAGELAIIELYKNGTTQISQFRQIQQTTHTQNVSLILADSIKLVAGDYIQIRVSQNSGASLALTAGSLVNFVAIERVGN